MHKPGTLHVSNLLHNFNHTCMLRDLLTSTQAFFKFTITQLARLWCYHLHISKQLSSIKLILVFNSLKRKFHISWTPSILTLSNYHAINDSQNNLSEAWEINSFFKTNPPLCSKIYKWSTRAKIITLKRYKWSTMSKTIKLKRYKWST